MRPEITQVELKETFFYDPDTGIFTRLTKPAGHTFIGQELSGSSSHPYLRVFMKRTSWALHRLAFLYMTGSLPMNLVDHINGDRRDNRWSNLRDVSKIVNAQNQRKANHGSASGLLGVYPHRKKFQSKIKYDGKTVHLGEYLTPELAHQAYVSAKRLFHEGCTI